MKNIDINSLEKHSFEVELDELAQVPIWLKNGQNWLAIIEKDPNEPGGLKRCFMKKATTGCFYRIDKLKLGLPVEFAAKYSYEKQSKCRWYGVVNRITSDFVEIIHTKTANQAILLSRQMQHSKKDFLVAEAENLKKRLAEIESELSALHSATENSEEQLESTEITDLSSA